MPKAQKFDLTVLSLQFKLDILKIRAKADIFIQNDKVYFILISGKLFQKS